ncbi:MAG: glycosyltransferase family 1 protein [Chitinophagaceae bacterium]|nr:MAG: glycosyltransferase family 1 protein [Chitinophagaceae bacterium]
MNSIYLDCDLMRYRNSGLYHYCLNLGQYVNKALQADNSLGIAMYVPGEEANTFDRSCRVTVERRWHKTFKPFLWGCDIWHAPFQSGRMLRKKGGKGKNLLTIHDLNVLHEGRSARECRSSLEKTQKLINESDAIVCISEHTKKDVLANMDVKDIPGYVVHNGTHHVDDPPAKPTSFVPQRPFLFSMGYVNRKKNFHTLIPLLNDSRYDLVIAGRLDEPEYIDHMRALSRKLGVEDRLHLTGPVSEMDKAWYLANCAAFVFPSLAEGFGAPVVEAMRFGRPLFLSTRTSLPEIGGEAAFYFQNFEPDHMLKVFQAGMEMFSTNGFSEKVKMRARSFQWEEKAMEYLKIYRSLLK